MHHEHTIEIASEVSIYSRNTFSPPLFLLPLSFFFFIKFWTHVSQKKRTMIRERKKKILVFAKNRASSRAYERMFRVFTLFLFFLFLFNRDFRTILLDLLAFFFSFLLYHSTLSILFLFSSFSYDGCTQREWARDAKGKTVSSVKSSTGWIGERRSFSIFLVRLRTWLYRRIR